MTTRLSVPVRKQDHVLGPMNAPVTLVEYGDFECPYCGQAYPIVKEIQEKMGSDLSPDVQNQPLKEIRTQYLSAQRARELLQWAPAFTVDEGLERTIAWYRRMFEEELARVGRPVNAL